MREVVLPAGGRRGDDVSKLVILGSARPAAMTRPVPAPARALRGRGLCGGSDGSLEPRRRSAARLAGSCQTWPITSAELRRRLPC